MDSNSSEDRMPKINAERALFEEPTNEKIRSQSAILNVIRLNSAYADCLTQVTQSLGIYRLYLFSLDILLKATISAETIEVSFS